MFAYTTEYTDYNGVKRTETFYFNFSKAELMEMELGTEGGLKDVLQRIVDANDKTKLIKYFKKLLLMAYGEKSDDGRRFVKSEELSKAFSQTEAYSKLFMELITSDEKSKNFVNAIIPKVDNPVPAPAAAPANVEVKVV